MFKYFIVILLFCLSPLWSMAQNCVADYGTIFPPEGIFTMVCQGAVSASFGVSGNNTATDYSSVFVVTNTNGSIAFINNGNSISFAALPNASGTFVVHAMNIRNTDLALLQTAISAGAISNLSDLQTAISNNQFCADLQLQGTQLHVTEPVAIDYVINCDNNVGEYAVTFDISGGSPPLINDNSIAYYTYTGILHGTSDVLGTSVVVAAQPDGNGFTLTVEDELCGTNTIVSEGSVACTKCHGDPGTMPMTNLVEVCGGMLKLSGAINAEATPDSGAVVYVIHTNPNDTLGTILAIDEDVWDGFANFSGELPNGAEYGVIYYVSAVGSNKDLDTGLFDWNSECLKVAPGTPIRFQTPVLISSDVVCAANGNSVLLTVNGENSPFSVGGDLFVGIYNAGSTMDTSNIADGNYNINVINMEGCIAHYEVLVDCNSSVAINPIASPSTWQMRIAPQPAQQSADLQFYMAQNADVQLVIYDLSGKTMTSQHIAANAGLNHIALDLSHYTSGLYVVQLNDSHSMATNKLLLK